MNAGPAGGAPVRGRVACASVRCSAAMAQSVACAAVAVTGAGCGGLQAARACAGPRAHVAAVPPSPVPSSPRTLHSARSSHPVFFLQLFGTLEGEVSIANHVTNTVMCTTSRFSGQQRDAILGLCWYRAEDTRKFFAASGNGTIKLCQFEPAGACRCFGALPRLCSFGSPSRCPPPLASVCS